MAKSPRKAYGTLPPKRFDGIILKLKKGGAAQALLTVFTKQQGWMRVFVPKGKRAGRQGSGGFFPLSTITFDAWERDGAYSMGEYESRANPVMAGLTLDAYVYTQIFIEMVLLLVAEREADGQVYDLLLCYSRAIREKDIRIVTIIAGWQLVAIAGFCPDVERVRVYRDGVDESGKAAYSLYDEPQELLVPLEISQTVRQLWRQLLSYEWENPPAMKIKVKDIAILEQLLYQYVRQCADRPLRAVALLRDIK